MKIAIIGLGLIGGSIGERIKDQSSKLKIIGIPRRKETIAKAIKLNAIDEGTTDMVAGVRDADVIFICTPINLIIPTLKRITPCLKPGAIVTEVGSSKEQIVGQAEKIMPKGTFFVGGHPMAGKEKVKLEAAEAKLFEGKTWILTPTTKTNKKALKAVSQLIDLLGGKIIMLDPKLHDQVVARISHLPLAVAAALVNTIADEENGKSAMQQCAASGLRDTTRIASGDPRLGIDMFLTNQKAILRALDDFKKELSRIEKAIRSGKSSAMAKELQKAKKFRDSIYS